MQHAELTVNAEVRFDLYWFGYLVLELTVPPFALSSTSSGCSNHVLGMLMLHPSLPESKRFELIVFYAIAFAFSQKVQKDVPIDAQKGGRAYSGEFISLMQCII